MELKANVDEALKKTSLVKKVVVFKHCDNAVQMEAGRDIWWSDAIARQSTECAPEPMDSEDPLFILYTSGSTGKTQGHFAYYGRIIWSARTRRRDTFLMWRGGRCLLVHGGCWAGLPGIRMWFMGRLPMGRQRLCTKARAELPGFWAILEHYREAFGQYFLHRSDRDSRVYEGWARTGGPAQSEFIAATGKCRRTD